MDADSELLRRFAEQKSQADFAELVRRNVDLVYAAALRRTRNPHHAEEVVQIVFIDLARKANRLWRHPALVSWLFTSTRYAAAKIVRTNLRRQAREQEAFLMHESLAGEPNADWTRLGPILDDAIQSLNERDRQAVLLRFFRNRSFSEVADALKLTEENARQSTGRALSKIQTLLRKRGITSTTAALAIALGNQAGIAAPFGLAAAVTGTAFAELSTVAANTGALAGLIKSFGIIKMTFAISGTVAAIVITIRIDETQRVDSKPIELSRSVYTEMENHADIAPLAHLAADVGPRPSSEIAPPRVLTDEQLARRNARQDARRDAKNRVLAIQRLTPLFDQLTLTTEQKQKLVQLVLDDHQAGIDVAAVNALEGIDISKDSDSYWESSAKSHRAFLAQVESLLGPDGYAAFRANDLVMRQSLVVEHLQKKLTPTSAQMSESTAGQLLSVLRELHTFAVDDQVIDRARTFLSPLQIDALIAERTRQQLGPGKPGVQKVIGQNLPSVR